MPAALLPGENTNIITKDLLLDQFCRCYKSALQQLQLSDDDLQRPEDLALCPNYFINLHIPERNTNLFSKLLLLQPTC